MRKGRKENMAIQKIPYRDKEEWLSIRRRYIGGSDAGAVVGMNPYKSAYTLWAEKTGQIPEFAGNLTTEVGAYLEAFVADLWSRETGKKVKRMNRVLVNDQYPFACADVDRVVVGEKAILEIKTTTSQLIMRQLHGSGDEFPDAYYCQCVHYLAVTGYDRIYLAVLVNNRELLTYTLERDEDEIAALMGEEEYFWNHNVMHRQPPVIDGSASTGETLETIIGDSTEAEADLTPFAEELKIYETLAGLQKDTERQMDEIKNKIRAYMGDAGKGVYDRFSITYKTQERTTFDKKALAADHPEIAFGKYEKASKSRPMTIRIKASA